jgi:hypothetical protein
MHISSHILVVFDAKTNLTQTDNQTFWPDWGKELPHNEDTRTIKVILIKEKTENPIFLI